MPLKKPVKPLPPKLVNPVYKVKWTWINGSDYILNGSQSFKTLRKAEEFIEELENEDNNCAGTYYIPAPSKLVAIDGIYKVTSEKIK